MLNWWRGFVARHIVADDPYPELSWLDRMDGLTAPTPMQVVIEALGGNMLLADTIFAALEDAGYKVVAQ